MWMTRPSAWFTNAGVADSLRHPVVMGLALFGGFVFWVLLPDQKPVSYRI
jgi:hypothetical protein